MTYEKTLVALADPTRRLLFEHMRNRAHTVGELAAFANIRQPTASQHLQILRGARLVTDHREGTRRYYRANPRGLTALRSYLETFWGDVLAAYAADDAEDAPKSARRRSRATPARGRKPR